MGVYWDHGIEYRIKLKDGSFVTIATTKATDARLLESEYYKNREGEWFNDKNTVERVNQPELITSSDFDIELYEVELERLESALEENKENVVEHGFYDVCYMVLLGYD